MHININLIWAVIIGWSAAALLAMVFVHGAHRNKLRGE